MAQVERKRKWELADGIRWGMFPCVRPRDAWFKECHLAKSLTWRAPVQPSCPSEVLGPPLIFPSPPCVTQLQPSGTSPWPAMLCGVFFKTTERGFSIFLMWSLCLCPFFFCFPLPKFCLTSSHHRFPKSQIKAFRDAEAPDSYSSTTRLCPLNWHEASTSFRQSNKLMLSGIDCLLLMVAGCHAAHWGN